MNILYEFLGIGDKEIKHINDVLSKTTETKEHPLLESLIIAIRNELTPNERDMAMILLGQTLEKRIYEKLEQYS
ncbi:MAG TPA: hypothetical protein PLN23_09710 [Fervidobacterium sp.]|nr:hypothetical protein [Fervidobacterium sp.]